MNNDKDKKNRMTKEIAIAITPVVAAYVFVMFYEAGYYAFFGLPYYLISINVTHVLLTNRMALMVAVIAFLWIGLYYNVLPSAGSPLFRGIITLIMIVSLWMGVQFGKYDASNQRDYLMSADHENEVIIRINNDTVIAVGYDSHTQVLNKTYRLFKINPEKIINLELKSIGPLRKP